MKRMFALVRLEILLWLKSVPFWLAALSLYVYTFGRFNQTLPSTRSISEHILSTSLMITSLLILFAAAGSIMRDRLSGTKDIVNVLPVKNSTIVISRWLAGTILWGLLGLSLFVTAGVALYIHQDAILDVKDLSYYYIAHFLPPIIYIHTAGLVCAILIKSPLILYPVLTAYWFAASPGTSAIHSGSWRWLQLGNFTGIGPTVIRLSEVLGLYPFEPFLFWHRIFYMALTITLIVLGVFGYDRQREKGVSREPFRRRVAFGLIVLMLPTLTISAFGYMELHLKVGTPVTSVPSEFADMELVQIDSYDMRVVINPPASYYVEASIDITNMSEEASSNFSFLLPQECIVEKVSSPYSGLEWRQGGGLLTVDLEDMINSKDQYELNLVYKCEPARIPSRLWGPHSSPEIMTELVYPQVLTSTMADWQVNIEAPLGYEVAVSLPVINSVKSEMENKQISQYQGKDTSLSVIGGLEHSKIAGLDAYYASSHRKAIQVLAGDLAERIDFYTLYLGSPIHVPSVTPQPIILEWAIPQSYFAFTNVSGDGFLRIGDSIAATFYHKLDPLDYRWSDLDRLTISLWLGQRQIGHTSNTFHTQVEAGLVQYLTVLYRENHLDKEYYEKVIKYASSNASGQQPLGKYMDLGLRGLSTQQCKVILILDLINQELGQEALKKVISAIHTHFLERVQAIVAGDLSVTPVLGMEPKGSSIKVLLNPGVREANENKSQIAMLQAIAALPNSDEVYLRAVEILSDGGVNIP